MLKVDNIIPLWRVVILNMVSESCPKLNHVQTKPWEFMLKVDNIIPLWRVVILNMVSEPCPKLNHVNRILKYQTKNCEPRRCSQKWLKCRGSRERSWASIKGRLIVYFVRGEDCWGLLGMSPTLVNLVEDHGFINEKYYLFLGKPKAKPWELMLKVDNIIPLWRVVIPNTVSTLP